MPRKISVLVGALVVILGLGAVAWVMVRDVIPDSEADAAARTHDATAAIEAARLAVMSLRPRAEGMTFGKTFVRWQGEVPAVCGKVDIEEEQNSLTGEERFVYLQGDLQLESEAGTAVIDQKWKDICTGS